MISYSSRGFCASLLTVCLLLPGVSGAQKPLVLHEEVLKQVRWRSIGPATMGGRISDIAVDEKNPYTFFVGLATGGLLKTTNNGTTWTPVFDDQPVASIGAVAVAPSDAGIVWVGTGEANGRNSSSWGNGVYKSTDSGQTWKHMGLTDTQEIGRIVIDPANPEVVYVAAAGHLWGTNKERGVFKTTDGGKTWQHSLAVDEKTGAIDLSLGAPGSNIVFAAMYQRRRYPWGFEGVGPGSGLYKSSDAGKTWKRLTNGLPSGPLGRIGLSVCKSKPNIVYAVVESREGGGGSLFSSKSKYGGVFRSDDAGETWKRTNGTVPRGFYFGQIRVDPSNPEQVYVLGFDLSVSTDGGKTFKDSSANVHSDLHTLWIEPSRPDHLILGTDGGLHVSHDRAKTWDFIANFPMGEFYEVSLDNRTPFWIYGGLQDNGSWAGPSALQASSGPGNAEWVLLTGGDGFYVLTDPTEPDIVYAESQGGNVVRIDRRLNKTRFVQPATPEGEQAFRFNWNTPMTLSHFDRDALYVGGNRVFRWTKQCTEWKAISPDLSRQHGERITGAGSGAETYGTIVSLAESRLKRGLLWAGTDDGNVQVTQDEGQTWANVSANLPEKVREYYVKRIEVSRYQPGRAYVAIDGHRSDDMAPYLFVTEDFGKSWRSLAGTLPKDGPVKAFREDPTNENLLFAGTEFGAFVSWDRGEHWHKLGGLPTVAVDDLAIHPRDRALVAATHGRSFYVLDNIAPLQALTAKTLSASVHLFPIPPAVEFLPADREWFGGSGAFRAPNPPSGAEIVYWLKTLADEPARITVSDAKGQNVATLTGERVPGLHRLSWNLRMSSGGARFVKPGVYTVILTVGKEKREQKVIVSGPAALSEKDPNADEEESGEETAKKDGKIRR